MKTEKIYIKRILTLVIILISGFFLHGNSGFMPDLPSKSVNSVKKDLELSEIQTESLLKALNIYNSQSILDREMFRTNSIALVESAKRRIVIFEAGMDSFLSEGQKMLYNSLKRDLVNEGELFILKEGLLLTDSQVMQAGFILEEYNSRIDIVRERSGGMGNRSDSGKKGMKGSFGGGRGSRGHGGRGGMRGGGRGPDGPGSEIGTLQSAKSKKLKTLLTESQQKLHIQLKKYMSAKRERGKKSLK